MRNDKENIILEKTFALALDIITYAEQIRNMKRYEMSSQIFRCGTSIGANVREAQNAESKSDFIHKFKIAAKKPMSFNTGWSCVPFQTIIRLRQMPFKRI